MQKSVVVVPVLFILSACASTPKPNPAPAAPPAAEISKPQTATVSDPDAESKKLVALLQDMQKKSVYFDFDKYEIEPAYKDVIQQQADFIKAQGNETVILQGNADERGSNEYNLALGEKRADTVRKYLELSGVSDQRIKILSFGEEKPRLACYEEKCWKENRRVDFVYSPD